jgi:hypothetical protein
MHETLPLVEFRKQVLMDRPEGEFLSSVMFRPSNSDGTFRTLGPQADFYERRAALNAAIDYFWGLYEIHGPMHEYSSHNPNRVGGSRGWIDTSKMVIPVNGNPNFTTRQRVNGVDYVITWPTKVLGREVEWKDILGVKTTLKIGTKVVDVHSNWLTVTEYAGNRLQLRNGQINAKHGKSDGELKHAYVSELHNGTQITVTVTLSPMQKNGETIWLDSLQKKALFFQSLIEVEGFEYNAAREKFIENRKQQSAQFQALNRLSKVEGAGTPEETQEALALTSTRANGGGEVGKTVYVNGILLDLGKIEAGIYDVVAVKADGTTLKTIQRGVNISRFAGSVIVERLHRRGGQGLVLVTKF